ncbi:MAG: Dyp-type peroxidase [Trichodesmium sp. MAG_R03]|nr:Dyp-type peroxidase [Trichodesmium sp. MAG_R03]
MIDINEIVEIEPLNNAEYRPLLQDLQGNIIKGHGRENAVHLFLKFKDGQQDKVKEFLGQFTRSYVTSALAQAYEAKKFREKKTKGSVFTNVFLTVFGYDYLGLMEDDLPFQEDYFLGGMQDINTQTAFVDPTIDQWDAGFQKMIHGLILMADDNVDELSNKVYIVREEVEKIAEVVQEEKGFVLRQPEGNGEKGKVIEHFGFRDGVSQPLFTKKDIEKERECDDTNFSNWDPRAPLSLVLLKDPFGKTEESYGSYLVYRKLEQDVPGWDEDVKKLAEKLNVSEPLAGAYTMGRFQDGTPLALEGEQSSNDTNNFNYQTDQTGSKCPFHAHIRKTNPRGDTGNLIATKIPLKEEKMHRIARRAISYGERERNNTQKTGSGLLFLCFQSNITNQFAFMQRRWANQQGFVEPGTGSDPVIGQVGAFKESYNWPTSWGSTERKQADFSKWVKFKGGEFFFTPSLSFLESLNEDFIEKQYLKVKHSGKVIDLHNPSSDKTDVIQATASNSNSQVWLLEDTGEDYFFIRNKENGLVLTVESREDGSQEVFAMIKHGGNSQQWKFLDNGDGYSYIVSKANNNVLDVSDSSQDDGANIIVYPQKSYDQDNQLWQLEEYTG